MGGSSHAANTLRGGKQGQHEIQLLLVVVEGGGAAETFLDALVTHFRALRKKDKKVTQENETTQARMAEARCWVLPMTDSRFSVSGHELLCLPNLRVGSERVLFLCYSKRDAPWHARPQPSSWSCCPCQASGPCSHCPACEKTPAPRCLNKGCEGSRQRPCSSVVSEPLGFCSRHRFQESSSGLGKAGTACRGTAHQGPRRNLSQTPSARRVATPPRVCMR